jgi:hypothetical protein
MCGCITCDEISIRETRRPWLPNPTSCHFFQNTNISLQLKRRNYTKIEQCHNNSSNSTTMRPQQQKQFVVIVAFDSTTNNSNNKSIQQEQQQNYYSGGCIVAEKLTYTL